MAARNGTTLDAHQLTLNLIRVAGPLVLFSVFHLVTDLLHWPKIGKKTGLQESKSEP